MKQYLIALSLWACLSGCASTDYFNPQPVINYCPSDGLSFSCRFGS